MSQYSCEKNVDSVKLLKDTIETKIDKLAGINHNLKKKLFDLQAILELSRQFNSNPDLYSLLENILLTCVKRLGVRGGLITVQKIPGDKSFSLTRAYGIEMKKGWEFSLASSLSVYLKEKNKPLFIKDVIKEFKSELKELQVSKLEVITPLLIRDNVRGILLLADKISDQPYSENDLEFLSLLVNQVTIVVENLLYSQDGKDANLELKKAQPQLMQTERLALLGQLSITIAQKITDPLGIIKNYLAILSQSSKKPDKSLAHLRVIKEEVDRIAHIVKQLTYFYRPKTEVKTLIDIGSLLEDTLSFVEKQFSKDKIYIKKEFQSNLPRIKVYPDELQQVFLNLLMNSKDSLPQGGEIEVSIRAQKEKLEIEFKDTGRWIEENDIPLSLELFDIPEVGEQRLGFWVSSEILKRHNGELRVKNREDRKGSCFNLSLPFRETDLQDGKLG
jgi:signal transduction histidine kinase